MNLSRREFLQLIGAASILGLGKSNTLMAGITKENPADIYNIKPFGNVSLLHFTDSHAQLVPAYYREPDIHLGIGNAMRNKIPHYVGKHLLERYGITHHSSKAYALTYLDFVDLAKAYGKTGGFAHMATLINRLRADRPGALLLDGGDTWQGSATALWSNAQDMVDAALLLGVDVMTGHWEFTYGAKRLEEILKNDFADKIDFVAQNVVDNEFEDLVFNPYVIKEINQIPTAVIGQAFPYTPIANPRHFVESWQFGIKEEHLQKIIDQAKGEGAKIVVLLSHNGMDIDIKLASRVRGLDAILGGHTHDAVPMALEVNNAGGKTLVINSGTTGKFVSVLDFDYRNGKIQDYQYRLLPVFSNLLPADKTMAEHIEKVRAPYLQQLSEPLAITQELLYRRGTFSGTFDQIIVDALMKHQDAEIAFSPGFRWGTTLLPGQTITMEDLMAQTAITYPEVRRTAMSGTRLKEVLEDIADNRFSDDPYHQQGGDMVRIGGLKYSIDPTAPRNRRILDMELNGKPINANKTYNVAAWAGLAKDQSGPKIWDVVAEYLRQHKSIKVSEVNVPKIKNVKDNRGIAV